MIIAILVLFGLIGLGCWFVEDTKIGEKLINKIIDNIMKY